MKIHRFRCLRVKGKRFHITLTYLIGLEFERLKYNKVSVLLFSWGVWVEIYLEKCFPVVIRNSANVTVHMENKTLCYEISRTTDLNKTMMLEGRLLKKCLIRPWTKKILLVLKFGHLLHTNLFKWRRPSKLIDLVACLWRDNAKNIIICNI